MGGDLELTNCILVKDCTDGLLHGLFRFQIPDVGQSREKVRTRVATDLQDNVSALPLKFSPATLSWPCCLVY